MNDKEANKLNLNLVINKIRNKKVLRNLYTNSKKLKEISI